MMTMAILRTVVSLNGFDELYRESALKAPTILSYCPKNLAMCVPLTSLKCEKGAKVSLVDSKEGKGNAQDESAI
jgi:hypothetical protein